MGSFSKRRLLFFFLLSILGIVFLSTFTSSCNSEEPSEEKYIKYCGSCHQLPDPANLPKYIWKDHVLPEMAARLGYYYNDFSLDHYGEEEQFYIGESNIYPSYQSVTASDWEEISNYILSRAPDRIENIPIRKGRSDTIVSFDPIEYNWKAYGVKDGISYIDYDPTQKQLVYGDNKGGLYQLDPVQPIKLGQYTSPISSFIDHDTFQYITEIGHIHPSEIPKGALYLKSGSRVDTIINKLHRPVYTVIDDLDNDGTPEVIICEYGHHTGSLTLLHQENGKFVKKTLAAMPGSIKVKVEDMNEDGKKDIVVLFAQAQEGIYTFYQGDDLSFSVEKNIAFKPEHGASWFELFDYEGDGDLDLAVVNGDNADYSITLKPYHGVRLYLNDGKNNFEEVWFYPINGATRIIADDFDQDGDFDFAVSAFFTDLHRVPEEGFVYLEKTNSPSFEFNAQISTSGKKGKWLIMESGDIDVDGDIDLILGHFTMPGGQRSSIKTNINMLILENQLNP